MHFFKITLIIFFISSLVTGLQSCRSCSRSGMVEIAKANMGKNGAKENNNYKPNGKHAKKSQSINRGKIEVVNNKGASLSTLYKKLVKGVIVIYTSDNENNYQGSGFIISADGIGISNYHVFKGTYKDRARIKLNSGELYKLSKVLEKNKELDYIIFKLDGNHFNYVPIAEEAPEVGENVFAIGTPKGLEYTLSEGIVSSVRSSKEKNDLLQTTTEITHGSSGGPLFNYKGEVVGITTSGMGEADLNFAINIEKLRLYRYLNN